MKKGYPGTCLRSRSARHPPLICLQCRPSQCLLGRTVGNCLGRECGLWEEAEVSQSEPSPLQLVPWGVRIVQYLPVQGKSCLWLLPVSLLMFVLVLFTGLNKKQNKAKLHEFWQRVSHGRFMGYSPNPSLILRRN